MTRLCLIIAVLLTSFVLSSQAFAQPDEEKKNLLLYFTEDELEVDSATRTPMPISRIAENITIISAAEIELMNAHTLADVLNTVPGVQVFATGGPGTTSSANIQGSDMRHVTVLIDGVFLNTLGDNVADIAMVPVQMIQKIEIIKGPASSAWGSALGGVVNIITKSGGIFRKGNTVSLSLGERKTDDLRVESMGKQDRLGYYLTAGRFQSGGLTPHMGLANNNAYGKISYDLTSKTDVQFTLGYGRVSRDTNEYAAYDMYFQSGTELAYSTIALNSALSKAISLNLSLRSMTNRAYFDTYQLSTGDKLDNQINRDISRGVSAKVVWKSKLNTLVTGIDIDDRANEASSIPMDRQAFRRTAVFLNDSLTLGDITLTPGVRYDMTNTNSNITSPSVGLAFGLSGNTVIRFYAGDGFNIPPVGFTYGDNSMVRNPDLKPEKVRSYQAGIETAQKHLWLKAAAFRNDLRDGAFMQQDSDTGYVKVVNQFRQRREGLDVELKTAPVYNTSFFAGAEFNTATDRDSGEKLPAVPSRIYDVSLQYDDKSSFRALLKGRYIDWNSDAPSDDPVRGAKDGTYIFDLNMIKQVRQKGEAKTDVFINLHNIFDQDQYLMAYYRNPHRWLEIGIRSSF